MRALCLALFFSLLLGVGAYAQKGQNAHAPAPAIQPSVFLPLVVVQETACGSAPEIPLITIGSLPEDVLPPIPAGADPFTHSDQAQWNTFEFKSGDDSVIAKILAGKIHFNSAPGAGKPTLLLLAAPMLNIRRSWIPTEIALEGNTITLEVTAWDGDVDAGAGKNFDCRAAYLISLGTLATGDYKFALHCTHLSATDAHGYEYAGTDDRARATFTVGAPKPQPPTTIPVKDLQTTQASVKDSGITHLAPRHWALVADVAPSGPPTLQVGTYDPNVQHFFEGNYQGENGVYYQGRPRQKTVPIPKGAPGNRFPGFNFAAIVAYPSLKPGEWIALHSVEYSPDRHAITITADYWHGNAIRAPNVRHDAPFLIIPELAYALNPTPAIEQRAKGNFTVTLQWRSLLSDAPGSPYTLQAIDPKDKILAPVTVKFSIYNR